MIVPYENYLKYLILKYKRVDELPSILKLQGFVPPDAKVFKDFYEEIYKFSRGLRQWVLCPGKVIKKPSIFMEWMKELGIPEIWSVYPTIKEKIGKSKDSVYIKPMTQALALLNFSEARERAEKLILNEATPKETLGVLKKIYNINILKESILLFEKYFWNVREVDPCHLEHYLKSLENLRGKKDFIKTAHGDQSYTKWKLGVEEDLDLDDMINSMIRDSYFKFKEAVDSGNLEESSKAAKAFADIVYKTKEIQVAQKGIDQNSLNSTVQEEQFRMILSGIMLNLGGTMPRSIEDVRKEIPIESLDSPKLLESPKE